MTPTSEPTPYNFDTFALDRVPPPETFGGPSVGERLVDFVATRIDGTEVRLSDYLGRVIVLETGSLSCPIYADTVDAMNRLRLENPDVAFLVLYTNEAHPGEKIGPHRSFRDKRSNAERTRDELGEHREILIDSLDGAAHTAYGGFPNMLYLIDATGRVVMRGHWSDAATLDVALERLRARESLTDLRFRFRYPNVVRALRTLLRAGWKAVLDGLRETPRFVLWHRRESRSGWG